MATSPFMGRCYQMSQRPSSSATARRRPLALIALWLPFILLAILYSPHPLATVWPQRPGESSLRRAFDLPPEPTLIVFHRPGGLTPADLVYVNASSRALQAAGGDVQIHGHDTGETCVVSLAASVADVPDLRADVQDVPDDLEVYVTGMAAFAYDAGISWRRARPLVLVGVTLIAGLVALFGKLGPRRALVVGVCAGSASAVASVLAALVAPPSPVALSAVVSAGLAGAWAVRLLTPRWFVHPAAPLSGSPPKSRPGSPPPAPAPRLSPGAPPPVSPKKPISSSPPIRRITPLQRAIIQAGEGTLLQALIIAAGLTGFLFDARAGIALLLSLVVAVVISLSGTPALIALLTKPRRPRPIPVTTHRKWLLLALALIPVVSLLWLTLSAHPADTVSRRMEAATGYELLVTASENEDGAGEDALTLGRLLPLHLLIQAPGVARSEAGLDSLRNLSEELNARPAIAAVEGAATLQPSPATDEGQLSPAEQTALLARLGRMAAELEVRLGTQASELSQVAADLQNLDLAASDALTTSVAMVLNEASERLVNVSEELADASAGLIRVPTEFPEIAPRMNDVPALDALPTTLDFAVADLNEITADLQHLAAQNTPNANSQDNPLTAIKADLGNSMAVLETVATDATFLRAELAAAEAMWAGAALGDSTPSAPDPYLVSHDLIRLVLIPAGDPYAADTLDDAQTLVQATERGLAGSPLADSELALTGTSAMAAGRRAWALQDLLALGVVVAALAVMLFAWGTLSQAGPALRLAAGAVLSIVAGVGVTSVVLWHIDASAIALVGVALVAMVGGRMAGGPVPNVEALALALPPLSLALAGVATLTAVGLALSAGLLAGHFLIAPALGYQPRS